MTVLDDQTIVALDLETSGLQPDKDEIIEIGALKFRGTQVLDTFQVLVNPLRSLSPFITLLTGITDDDLHDAPPLSQVGRSFLDFVGDAPIVGQNVSFDLAFLKEKGLPISGPVYDTLEMALILHPRLPEHGLAALAQALGLSHDNPHRALEDARVTMHVFLRLLERIPALQPHTLQAMGPLVRGHDWPFGRLLLSQPVLGAGAATGEGDEGAQALARAVLSRMETEGRAASSLHPRLVSEPLEPDRIADLLGPQGPLAASFPAFEDRTQQRAMARDVVQALNEGKPLLVEAGAGTGKSLAYLVPAFAFAQANSAPVLVATSTRGLQEQLFDKDIRVALSALGPSAPDLRVALLKGRGNYLCLHRLVMRLQRPGLSLQEIRFLFRLLVWLEESASGDQGELTLWPHERRLWNLVSASDGATCPFRRRGACFISQVHRAVEGAHLILTNHAFLLADIARGRGLLSHVRHIILDEAHHLEAEATSQFGDRVDQTDVTQPLMRLRGQGDESLHIAERTRAAVAARSLAPARLVSTEAIAQEVNAAADRALDHAQSLFTLLEQIIIAAIGDRSDYQQRLRLNPAPRQPQWPQALRSAEDLNALLQDLNRSLGRLGVALEDTDDPGLQADLDVEAQTLLDLQARLQALLAPQTTGDVRWISRRPDTAGSVALERAPLHTGSLLRERLFSQKDASILTSATLTIGRSFDYTKSQLGLEPARHLHLESPFNYRAASAVFIPRDMPEPDKPAYGRTVERTLVDLAVATGGHTLALFTSYAALRSAHAFAKVPLEAAGVGVLAQGIDGDPARLLTIFRRRPTALLLGTASFWEGVDLAGEALQLLVMARLPFQVPTDPVFAARAEACDDPFLQYTLPQALLRFRQGFGRLLRTRRDQGAVVILDARVLTKSYGQAFVDSLPGSHVATPTLRDISGEVAHWLGNHPVLDETR